MATELTTRRQLRLRRRWWTSVGIWLVLANLADAAPLGLSLERRQNDHQQASSNRNDDPNGGGSDVSAAVWAPAVAVVLFILVGFFFLYTRTSILGRLRGAASRAFRSASRPGTPANFTGTNTREVTAAQLTGVGRNSSTTRNANNNSRTNGRGRANPRTSRRNRRTPSQMSTHSLPVYMKEPGDQELVIFRGPDEMDVAMDVSIAEAREAEDQEDREDEEGGESGSLSRQETRASAIVPDEATPAQNRESMLGPGPRPQQSAMSLGVNEEREADPDTSTTQLLPQAASPTRQREQDDSRRDSGNSADSASGLMRRTSGVPSEAPPDYEFAANLANASDLQRERDSLSTAACGMDPPGLTNSECRPGTGNTAETRASSSRESYPPSSSPVPPSISSASPSPSSTPQSLRLVAGVGGGAARRSRFVSHVSRMSQFFHLRNASNANATDPTAAEAAVAENNTDAGVGRVSDATPGEVLAARTRSDSRISNVVSLDEPPTSTSPIPSSGQYLPRQLPGQSHRHSNSSTSALSFHLPLRSLTHTRSSNTLSSAFAASASRSNLNLHRTTTNGSTPNQGQGANLTSPSTLSLGQSILAGQTTISPPLPHTLMRTEIRYPAGGPTPDQVKLLSSREGLGRFGVPYGESAVEYARSSRLGLSLDMGSGGDDEPPPPVFESPTDEHARETSGSGMSAGESREHRASASGSGSSTGAHDADQPRRSVDSDVGGDDDPDALPPAVPSTSNADAGTNGGNSAARSSENLHTIETRALLPLFL